MTANVEDIIRRFLGGENQAFDEIVQLWETRVFNLAWRFLGNREDAQDVAQETFLSVYLSLRSLRDLRSFPTWLHRIALNHCRARWRARPSDLSLDNPLPAQDGMGKERLVETLLVEQARDPLETIDLLRKSLAGLSDEHRTAIILKEYVGLNLEEVAEVTGCPLSTAKSRLYHGLRGVQRNLTRLLRTSGKHKNPQED